LNVHSITRRVQPSMKTNFDCDIDPPLCPLPCVAHLSITPLSLQSPTTPPPSQTQDRLYYVALRALPKETASAHFFNIDNDLVYWNFFLDFGPLNLGQLYRFCALLNNKLQDSRLKRKVIYFYSGTHLHRRTNAAFLISAWSMLYLNKNAIEGYKPFTDHKFPPFHDASPCQCSYNLTVLDCLQGIEAARKYNFFDFSTFNCEEYEYFEQVENGDLNWHIQDKILCFAGPHNSKELSREGYRTLTPDDYIPYFRKKNVKLVIRLNKKYYDERKFINAGIDHVELYYLDGSVPPSRILKKVLSAIDNCEGAIAIHCKAGLGRAGTCTASWIMKTYRLTAAQTIGWMRICRPGTIIGPQQHFLQEMEASLWNEGDIMRARVKRGIGPSGEQGDDDDLSDDMNSLTVNNNGSSRGGDDERIVGRPGQSEELRTRRAQK
jgi:cell division cycle 14